MSFHGGMLGVVVALLLYTRRQRLPARLRRPLAVVVPIGLGLGRVANFINGELWGRAPPGPAVGDDVPDGAGARATPASSTRRCMEGVLLLVVLALLCAPAALRARHGLLTGASCSATAVARIIGEHLPPAGRVPRLPGAGATMGQLLGPDVLAGIGLMSSRRRSALRAVGGARTPPGPVAAAPSGAMERLDAFMARANAAYYATRDPFRTSRPRPRSARCSASCWAPGRRWRGRRWARPTRCCWPRPGRAAAR